MKPLTMFEYMSTEDMYRAISDLVACEPEKKVYDDGTFRIILVHARQSETGNPEPAYIIMDYNAVDAWEEHERWLVVADDGEHPNGYATLEEAMEGLRLERVKVQARSTAPVPPLSAAELAPLNGNRPFSLLKK